MKKTVVLGATPNPERYAFLAVRSLLRHRHAVVPVGSRPGNVDGQAIETGQPAVDDVDTITLYLRDVNQRPYYDYILALRPKRIIFNPGTENSELEALAHKNDIEIVHGCTLVMLSTGQY